MAVSPVLRRVYRSGNLEALRVASAADVELREPKIPGESTPWLASETLGLETHVHVAG